MEKLIMKNGEEEAGICSLNNAKSKLKSFWEAQAHKVKHGEFKCPLCQEVFKGLSAMGAHLKDHCT